MSIFRIPDKKFFINIQEFQFVHTSERESGGGGGHLIRRQFYFTA